LADDQTVAGAVAASAIQVCNKGTILCHDITTTVIRNTVYSETLGAGLAGSKQRGDKRGKSNDKRFSEDS
jgi:hypothetical protein